VLIWAGVRGHLDDIPREDIQRFERGFHLFLEQHFAQLLHTMQTTKTLDDDVEKLLTQAVGQYKQAFLAGTAVIPDTDSIAEMRGERVGAPAGEPVAVA